MGQLVSFPHGVSFEPAPETGSEARARPSADAPAIPTGVDSEARKVLSLLRAAMDRLPE